MATTNQARVSIGFTPEVKEAFKNAASDMGTSMSKYGAQIIENYMNGEFHVSTDSQTVVVESFVRDYTTLECGETIILQDKTIHVVSNYEVYAPEPQFVALESAETLSTIASQAAKIAELEALVAQKDAEIQVMTENAITAQSVVENFNTQMTGIIEDAVREIDHLKKVKAKLSQKVIEGTSTKWELTSLMAGALPKVDKLRQDNSRLSQELVEASETIDEMKRGIFERSRMSELRNDNISLQNNVKNLNEQLNSAKNELLGYKAMDESDTILNNVNAIKERIIEMKRLSEMYSHLG